MRRALVRAGIVVLALAAGGAAAAEDYPVRPVRLVAPFPPGGVADILARLIGQNLTASLGQSIVVENRPGAGGTIGTEAVAKAPGDGYTLLLGSVAMLSIAPSVYPALGYDPVADFVPVATLAMVPVVLVVGKAVPARSVRELIALARAEPDRLTFGSSGNGAIPHLAAALFMSLTGTRLVHVPYRGTAQALNDIVAGQITMIFDNLPSSLPHIRAGNLIALGSATAARLPSLPDLPTIAEAGVPDFEVAGWFGVLAPAGTPAGAVARLRAGIAGALADPDFRARLASQGAEPLAMTPDAFAAMIKSDREKWAAVVKANNIRVD
jgi:tripartite-type tricarboxylate transporter receptor subunit TctC